jgi:hypothetical protein
MTFEAHMHVLSLEVVAALLFVAVVAARPRSRALAEIGRLTPLRLTLDVREGAASRSFDGL